MLDVVNIGPISISTYFLWMSLIWVLLLLWLPSRCRNLKFDHDHALNMAFIMMVTGVLGGRLLFVLWEDLPTAPQLYSDDPWRAFRLWDGGFVYYGGAIAAVISACAYAKWHRLRVAEWADFFTPMSSLGYSLGRWGCLLAGCCYGKSCDLPWAISGRHPTQAYAALYELGVFFLLQFLRQLSAAKTIPSGRALRPGGLFWTWLALHSVGRLIMEQYRDDFRGSFLAWTIGSFNIFLSLGEIISWTLLALALYRLLATHLHFYLQQGDQS